jgi:hypothetical protein
MLLNRGLYEETRLIKPESVSRMETPMTNRAASAGFPLGYGLGNYTTLRNGYIFHGHDGMISGFSASYGYNVTLDRGYAVSINKVSAAAIESIKNAIYAYITMDAGTPEFHAADVSIERHEILPGYYQSITPMSQLLYTLLLRFMNIRRISLEDGKLHSRNFLFGKNRELTPLSDNRLYRKYSHEILTVIDDGAEIIICYDGLRGNFKKISKMRAFSIFMLFILSLLLIISPLVYLVVWLPRKFLGKMKDDATLKIRIIHMLAALFFLITYLWLLVGSLNIELDKSMMMKLGNLTLHSISLFLSSVAFAIFSLLGCVFSLRSLLLGKKRFAMIYHVLVSIAQAGAVVYLWHGTVIGIMTWSH